MWVYGVSEESASSVPRYGYKERSSPPEALQSRLMRLIAVHAVKHKNAEEEPKQPVLQLHFIPTHVLSVGLCVSTSRTHTGLQGQGRGGK